MSNIITNTYNLNITPGAVPTVVYLNQNENGRLLKFNLISDVLITIPSGSTATFEGTKPDGHIYSNSASLDISNNTVTVQESIQMTAVDGEYAAKIKIINGNNIVATGTIKMVVSKDSTNGGTQSDTQLVALVAQVRAMINTYGNPWIAETASQMTNTEKIYVYTGNESGYTNGNWYYWNGSAWRSGGVYNSTGINVDNTLSVEGKAADAKATGDALNTLNDLTGDVARRLQIAENDIDDLYEDTVDLPIIREDLSGAKSDIIDIQNNKVNLPLTQSLPDYGTNGQVLRTLGNGSTEWANVGQPTYDQTKQAVSEWLEDNPESTTTVIDGSITENKLSVGLKTQVLKDYVTPEMYGGVGDGVANDTEAFVAACASGKTVYVKNSVISNCEIENCKVICHRMVLTGTVRCKSLDISGNIYTFGGGFVIHRDITETHRDDSKFHDLFIDVTNGCSTLITISGTLYNVRIINVTVRGKCGENTIFFDVDNDDGWITYCIIKDCMLGTCDRPIRLRNFVDGLQIVNTIAQRYEPTNICKFITTSARKGKLFILSSFMYDLNRDAGDTQIYLDRGEVGDRNYGQKFNICAIGQLGAMPFESQFAQDSDGAEGIQLAQEISYMYNDINGNNIQPRPVKNTRTAWVYKENINNYTGYGYAVDVVVPGDRIGDGTGKSVIGTAYRGGNRDFLDSPDYVIGIDSDNVLTTLIRNKNNQTPERTTYVKEESIAPYLSFIDEFIHEITSGVVLDDLSELPDNVMGIYRLSATLSPTGSAFYAPLLRFGQSDTGIAIVVRPYNGAIYCASCYQGNWGSWKQISFAT